MGLVGLRSAYVIAFLAVGGALLLVPGAVDRTMAQNTQKTSDGGPKGPQDVKDAGYYCVSAGFCFCHNVTECRNMESSGECVPKTIRYHKTGLQGEASCQWRQEK